MNSITSVTIFSFVKNKFWAFSQMGVAPKKVSNVKGLSFYKFLGTGGGQGFSLYPDFSTYAFLGVWDNYESYNKCLTQHPIFINYQRKADTQRDLVLKNINSHGSWDGINPFKLDSDNSKNKAPEKVVVITRATLSWNRLPSFWNAVPKASKAIKNAKGVVYYKGIGEWPFIQQATISIWDNFKSINEFAYKDKIHSDIVKVTRKKKWYKEDLFSRFNLISDTTKKLRL